MDEKDEKCIIMVPLYGSDLLAPLVNMYKEAYENKSVLFTLLIFFLSQKSNCSTSKISESVCVWGGGGGVNHIMK